MDAAHTNVMFAWGAHPIKQVKNGRGAFLRWRDAGLQVGLVLLCRSAMSTATRVQPRLVLWLTAAARRPFAPWRARTMPSWRPRWPCRRSPPRQLPPPVARWSPCRERQNCWRSHLRAVEGTFSPPDLNVESEDDDVGGICMHVLCLWLRGINIRH